MEISILGTFEMRVGKALIRPTARKDCALLAVLATSPDRPHRRARLAGLLWSEREERLARESLKQSLLRLRRFFTETGIDALRVDRDCAALNLEAIAVDALALQDAARGDDVEAISRALELRRGEPYADLDDIDPAFRDWALVERARLDALYVDAALAAMRRFEAEVTLGLAAGAARRVLAVEPLNEEATRAVMRWRLSLGERGRAVELYERLRLRLAEDLGVEPEETTRALRDSVRNPSSAAVDAPGADAILVLPFLNLGDDLAQNYFAEGLAEDVATNLARIAGFAVTPSAIAREARTWSRDPAAAARERGARHVLTGSVRRDGGRLRVTCRLLAAADGRQLWAERYDRPMSSLFDLQDELGRSVAEALRATLAPRTAGAVALRRASDVETFEFFLKARSFQMRGVNGSSLRMARLLLLRAIERDPGFARAHAQLAICEAHLAMSEAGLESGSGDVGEAGSQRALSLDPGLAEAHAALGLSRYAAGRYREADAALAQAVAIDPTLFEAAFFLGRSRRLQGRRDEAAAHFARAAALEPTNFRAIGLLGEELQALGKIGEARMAFERCLERLEIEIAAHPDNADALAFGSAVLADLGRLEQAEEWARWAAILGGGERLVHFNLARTATMLDRRSEALERLEQAFDMPQVVRRRLALWLAHDEDLAPLSSSAPFRKMMAFAETG